MKNKKFVIGLVLFILGLVTYYNFTGDGFDFLKGLMTGSGIAILVSSFIKKNKTVE